MSEIPATGLVIPTEAEELESIQTQFLGDIDEGMILDPEEPFGQITAIAAERVTKNYEALQAVYLALTTPGGATGVTLDLINALLGIPRLAATKSAIAGVYLFGSVATSVPAGTEFSVPSTTGTVFVTDSTVVLIAGTDEVQTITFVGTPPTSGEFKLTFEGETTVAIDYTEAAAEVQAALNALTALSGVTVSGTFTAGFVVTFDGVDGLQPQEALGYTDNTLDDGSPVAISVAETTPGVNQGVVDCTAKVAGSLSVNAETLTQIETPVAGLVSILNPVAAISGVNRETDAEYRARRENELVSSQAGTGDGIRSGVLGLNNTLTGAARIVSVAIFINRTKAVDALGLPESSFRVVVYQTDGGTTLDDDIAQKIFDAHPYGIESDGSVVNIVVDDEGFDQIVKFERPNEITIYCDIALTVDINYPIDGDDQVEAAVIAFGEALQPGDDVIVNPQLIAAIASVPGITDTVIDIGTAPAPSGDANIIVPAGDITIWSGANITVTS